MYVWTYFWRARLSLSQAHMVKIVLLLAFGKFSSAANYKELTGLSKNNRKCSCANLWPISPLSLHFFLNWSVKIRIFFYQFYSVHCRDKATLSLSLFWMIRNLRKSTVLTLLPLCCYMTIKIGLVGPTALLLSVSYISITNKALNE